MNEICKIIKKMSCTLIYLSESDFCHVCCCNLFNEFVDFPISVFDPYSVTFLTLYYANEATATQSVLLSQLCAHWPVTSS